MKYFRFIAPGVVVACLWLTAMFHVLLVTALAGRALGLRILGENWILIALPLHVCGFGLLLALIVGILLRRQMAGTISVAVFIFSAISTTVLMIRAHFVHGMGFQEQGMLVPMGGHLFSWTALGMLFSMFRKQMFLEAIGTRKSPNTSLHGSTESRASAPSSAP